MKTKLAPFIAGSEIMSIVTWVLPHAQSRKTGESPDISESTDYVSIVLSLDTSTEVVIQEKRVWSDGIPYPFESLKFCTDGLKIEYSTGIRSIVQA